VCSFWINDAECLYDVSKVILVILYLARCLTIDISASNTVHCTFKVRRTLCEPSALHVIYVGGAKELRFTS
jgi:hypothetical protein